MGPTRAVVGLALSWVVASAARAATVQLPATELEIEVATSAEEEVTGALAELAAGNAANAARRLDALCSAATGPDLCYLAASAWYDAGMAGAAKIDVDAGLARAPKHPALLALRGLLLADAGQGDAAAPVIAQALAAAPQDRGIAALAALDRGLIALDRGDAATARAAFEDARRDALAIGAAEVAARAETDLAAVEALEGKRGTSDPLGQVSDAVARGDLAAARAAVPRAAEGDRRGKIRSLVAEGIVARAEGRFDAAAQVLGQAISQAKQGGLIRELAAAQAQLGVVYAAANRPELAREQLDQAVSLVSGTSFRVAELSYRLAAARVCVRVGDRAAAATHLERARKAATGVADPYGQAALLEITGLLAADPGAARSSFEAADAAFVALGAWADAARVATEQVEALAGRDTDAAVEAARAHGAAMFAKANDPLGPAHLGIAEGLGRARVKDADGAVRAFLAAAQAAEGVGGERGARLAQLAKENAAGIMVALSDGTTALADAKSWGIEDMVGRYQSLAHAREAYEAARAAYEAGRFPEAAAGFDDALADLEAIHETGYALQARRGRAWAQYNANLRASPGSQYTVYTALIADADAIGDPDLRARALVQAGLAAADLGRADARELLHRGGEAAEEVGLAALAAQCWAEAVDHEATLADKVAAANRAYTLDPGKIGTYALYAAAVAAYDAEDYPEAVALSDRVLPRAGELTEAVKQVRDAAASQLQN